MKAAKQAKIYQIKVTLKYIRPPIWRRIEVPGDVALNEVHSILQAAMGWYNSHLHQFKSGRVYYGQPSIDEFSDLNLQDERQARLGKVLSKPKQKMIYEYDFGDGWKHEVLLEKISQPEPGRRYPRCIGGARACPPEDVGGTGGYENFLAAIGDPAHEEHDEYVEWIGGEFDPEEFDADDFETALNDIVEFSED